MTSITYDSGASGAQATPAVTFGYDSVGNRQWMDDGPGRVDYNYNSLSQLNWEERTLNRNYVAAEPKGCQL